jgi:hypothetical protein
LGLLISAAEAKFDEKKVVRGPGGRFGDKKDVQPEPSEPSAPQVSPEEREKRKQLNAAIEKINNTARNFAFGRDAIAKLQNMANNIKGVKDVHQVFKEAQKASQELQISESLNETIQNASEKIKEITESPARQPGLTKEQAIGTAIGVAVVLGGILGVVQKRKAVKLAEELLAGGKVDLDIEAIAKQGDSLGSNAEVNEATSVVNNKLQDLIESITGTKAKQQLAKERSLQRGAPVDTKVPRIMVKSHLGDNIPIKTSAEFQSNYKQATADLHAVADDVMRTESCVVMNLKTGQRSKVIKEKGGSSAVTVNTLQKGADEVSSALKDKVSDLVFLHTHPRPGGLSIADFDVSKAVAWVHAVDSHGNVFQGKMIKGQAADLNTIETAIDHLFTQNKKAIQLAKQQKWDAEHADEYNVLAHHMMAEYAKKRGLVQHEVQLTPGWQAFMERHDSFMQSMYSELDSLIS